MYVSMRDHGSMFNRILQEEDKQYVLIGVLPGQVASVPNFRTRGTIQEWISWS